MDRQNTFLRYALLADAIASGATGLLLITGADLLTGLLGLPMVLMREAGLLLVPYVAFVAFVGTREAMSRRAVPGDHYAECAVGCGQHRAAGERMGRADPARLRIRDRAGD